MCSYFIWTNTAAALSLVLHAPVLQAQGIIPVDHSQGDKLQPVELPCIPPLHPLEFVESIQRRGVKYNLLLETSRCILHVASGVLVNSLYELEASVFDALHEYYQVGAPSSKVTVIFVILIEQCFCYLLPHPPLDQCHRLISICYVWTSLL